MTRSTERGKSVRTSFDDLEDDEKFQLFLCVVDYAVRFDGQNAEAKTKLLDNPTVDDDYGRYHSDRRLFEQPLLLFLSPLD